MLLTQWFVGMDMDTVKKKGKHDTSSDAGVLKGMGISQEGIDAAKYMISCLIEDTKPPAMLGRIV